MQNFKPTGTEIEMESGPENERGRITLDTHTLESRMAPYPNAVREASIWLGVFCREQCKGDLRILQGLAAKHGFSTTVSTYGKILRGRWNTSANGTIVTPALNEGLLLKIVAKLQSDHQLKQLMGQVNFVPTSTFLVIKDYIDVRRSPGTICKFGFIAGPTGAQKSESFKEMVRKDNGLSISHVESPAKANIGEFVTKFAKAFGIGEYHSTNSKRRQLRQCVNESKTVIFDNIQKLYKIDAGWDQPIFNYLQELQDETGFTAILSVTLDFATTIMKQMEAGHFEQFEGRVGGRNEFLILPEFAPMEDVLQIANSFGLKQAERHADYLLSIAKRPGRIRTYFNALQKAKRQAAMDEHELDINHVRRVMLQPALIEEEVA